MCVRVRVNLPNDRRPLIPGHVHTLGMMTKVIEVQTKLSSFFCPDYVAEFFDIPRLAVRREPHHFAFIAVVGEAEKLRRGRINNSGGVWILYLIQHLDRIP